MFATLAIISAFPSCYSEAVVRSEPPLDPAEKDRMPRLLHDEAKRCEGRLLLSEKKYFDSLMVNHVVC
jgi:hypothetical protein